MQQQINFLHGINKTRTLLLKSYSIFYCFSFPDEYTNILDDGRVSCYGYETYTLGDRIAQRRSLIPVKDTILLQHDSGGSFLVHGKGCMKNVTSESVEFMDSTKDTLFGIKGLLRDLL